MSVRSLNSVEVANDLYGRVTVDGEFEMLHGADANQDTDITIWQYSTSSTATDNWTGNPFTSSVIKPTAISVENPGRWLKRKCLVQGDWNQATSTHPEYIKNKPSIPSALSVAVTSIAAAARNFDQAYQVDTDQYAEIRVSVSITCTLSLAGGTSGEVFLEYSADGSTGWTLAGKLAGSNTGTLTIGLNTSQITGGEVSCMLEPGYYWRLRTNTISGTPTYAFTGGTESVYN
jgi:hypothetical protein